MRIAIVEDEKVAARRLMRGVIDIVGSNAIVDWYDTYESARINLPLKPVDVVLLDLNLHGEDGFELLKNAAAESFSTIVVSANTDRAIEAFEYGVADFVPKPFDIERLSLAFERLRSSTRAGIEESARFLMVKESSTIKMVPIEEIRFLKGAGDYVELHKVNGEILLHGKSLESLEQILPPRFERIHKSYIVDIEGVVRLHVFGGGKYELELKNTVRLPLARSRYKDLAKRLQGEG